MLCHWEKWSPQLVLPVIFSSLLSLHFFSSTALAGVVCPVLDTILDVWMDWRQSKGEQEGWLETSEDDL